MTLHGFGGHDDPTSAAILRAQHESLMNFASALLAQQKRLTEQALTDLDRELARWRRRVLAVVGVSTRLLMPWLATLALLLVATLWLSARSREAWKEYGAAAAALERVRSAGALTTVRDGKVFVRIDRDSLAQGQGGHWYAQAVSVEFREDSDPNE